MRKHFAIMLAMLLSLSVLAGCGQSNGSGSASGSAASTETSEVDVDSFQTMGEILALEAERNTSAAYDDSYVYAFEHNGTFYRVIAPIPADVSKKVQKLDVMDENYNAEMEKLISPLKIDRCENLSEQIPSKAELDKFAGKTGEDLLKDNWVISGYDLSTSEFYMDHGVFQYKVTFDNKFDPDKEINAEEEIKPLKIKSVEFYDFGDNVTDIEQPEETAEEEQADTSAEAAAGEQQADTSAEAAPAESDDAGLSDSDRDALMKQVADKEVEKSCAKYLPDEAFANAEIFGIDRDGDNASAYVYLNTAEYVALKDKAYEISGSTGEAIIRFASTENGPKLNEVEWSTDGAGHDEWVKKNFPKEYYEKSVAYNPEGENGGSKLGDEIAKEVEKVMNVPVETENILEIDYEKGAYKITKTIESGDSAASDYKFDTETLEEGKLSDLG